MAQLSKLCFVAGLEPLQFGSYPASLLPKGHQLGVITPEGGSSCASCAFLASANPARCGNESFGRWNGSENIPAPAASQYCCDLWRWASDGPSGPNPDAMHEPGTSSVPPGERKWWRR